MATDQARTFNVWLVSSNNVYRGVPYTVVCDWIQEGRLTKRDCARTATETNWQFLGEHPLFKAYFEPVTTTATAEDEAEALEEIAMEFQPRGRHEEEEEDPDMIPLIDISMVLLVFFMMTAQDLLTAAPYETPKAANVNIISPENSVSVNMRRDQDDIRRVKYYFNDKFDEVLELGEKGDFKAGRTGTLIAKVEEMAQSKPDLIVIISAEASLPFEEVQKVSMKISGAGVKSQQAKVGEKPPEGGNP
jgi:biopolymer transport protein ExbD